MKFTDVMEAFKNGAKIKRKDYEDWISFVHGGDYVSLDSIMADDWEILSEDTVNENCLISAKTTAQIFLTAATANIPLNIICNGFNMKQIIIDVLEKYENMPVNIELLADEIQAEFGIKLGIRQG